jgi:hypothetical protein
MRFGRVAVAGLSSLALAAVFSGCVVFQQPATIKQLGKKPKVSVKFRACMSISGPGSTCPDRGNSEESAAFGDFRLLVGFRVPKGTEAPKSFEAGTFQTNGGGASAPVLSRDASYKRELNQSAPRNANKFKYLGYSSEPINVDDDTGTSASALFRVKMTVPEDLVGKKFKVVPVLGSYQVSDAQPASDPIDCGPDPFESTGDQDYFDGEWRVCIDAPAQDEFKPIKVKIKPKGK